MESASWILHLKFPRAFFKNHRQFVKRGQKKSNICSLTYGVPQGSILGPLLFLIYIGLKGDVALYADDICLYCFVMLKFT